MRLVRIVIKGRRDGLHLLTPQLDRFREGSHAVYRTQIRHRYDEEMHAPLRGFPMNDTISQAFTLTSQRTQPAPSSPTLRGSLSKVGAESVRGLLGIASTTVSKLGGQVLPVLTNRRAEKLKCSQRICARKPSKSENNRMRRSSI